MNWFRRNYLPATQGERKPLLRPLRTGIFGLYITATLVVALGITWSSWNDYQRALQETETQTLSLARLLDEHATRSLVSVDQAMQNVGEDIERSGGTDQVNERWLYERLKEKVQLTPQIRAIIAMNSKGVIRIHGLEYPARRVDLSDRDYFAYHRDNQDRQSRIGDPIVSRTDNKWLLPLTKRLNHPDGSYDGVMLAGMEPNYFLRFYDTLRLDKGTRIQLLRKDGVELLNYPHNAATLGRNLRTSSPAAFDKLSGTGTVFFRGKNSHGAEVYVTQLSNQTNLPLIVRITTEQSQVLGKYRQEIITKVTTAILLMLVTSIMFYLLMRQIKRVEESEFRLYLTQFTVDESPDMVLWCDEHGRVTYGNHSITQTSGHSTYDLKSLKYTDLFVDNDDHWENLRQQMQQLQQIPVTSSRHTRLQIPQRHNLETYLRDSKGHLTPVETTLSLIEFRGSTYLCVTARDITERQEAERELRRHRDHLQDMVQERTSEIRTVLDASPLAIVLSVQDHIRLVNPAFKSLFGFDTAEIVGKTNQVIFESEQSYRHANTAIANQVVKGGTYRGELELRQRNGMVFWAMLFAKALSSDAPERGMILIIEDITAQRIAAQVVRQSERLKRSILNTTADGFALIDAQRRLVDVNASFCDILGLKRQKLIDQQPETIWGDLAERLFPRCADSAAEKHFEEIELPAHDGLLHPFLANSGVIPDENGVVEYTFVFLTDISHQKEIERTLLESKEAAEAANKSKTAFLTNMSHELRTPMHAILSFSEMGTLKAGQASAEQVTRYFERIHTSGKRLLTLLNDLLDMSRLDANKMSYDKSRHILQSTVRAAISEIASLLAAKHIQARMDESTPKILAIYDKTRIIQVLVNLLSNAIKFSPQGAEIHIDFIHDISLENGTPAVGLVIRDEGPGIPEADLERIFETFTQSAQAHVSGGTGLGLAISRQIMNDHAGSISARNHPAGGAAFTLLLPVDMDTNTKPETIQPEKP